MGRGSGRKKSKLFYAVARGRKVGIFASWDECNLLVSGYSGCLFKSFTIEADVVAWMEHNKESLDQAVNGKITMPSSTPSGERMDRFGGLPDRLQPGPEPPRGEPPMRGGDALAAVTEGNPPQPFPILTGYGYNRISSSCNCRPSSTRLFFSCASRRQTYFSPAWGARASRTF